MCKVKIPNDTPQKEENDLSLDFEDYVGICFQKNKLVAATKDGFSIETVFNLISELSKPSDPAECINPYFDQFFNLVPVQFILFKLLRNLSGIHTISQGLSPSKTPTKTPNKELTSSIKKKLKEKA